MAIICGSFTGGMRGVAVLLAVFLVLLASCWFQQTTAEPSEFVPRRLVDMTKKELEDSINLFQLSEESLSKREHSVMEQLGRGLPDGRQKNELRVMAMKHLNNYDAIRKLEAELDRRAQMEAGHQLDAMESKPASIE